MGLALQLYEDLTNAGEDRVRARVIAEALEQIEARYPDVRDMATKTHISETELRLQKEIESTRLQIKEVEANLKKDIQAVQLETQAIRLEIKEVEAKLQKDIQAIQLEMQAIRLEIKDVELRLQKEIQSVEVRLTRTIHRQTVWVVLAIGGVTGLIRWMDVLFK
jgi:hypothetical protein